VRLRAPAISPKVARPVTVPDEDRIRRLVRIKEQAEKRRVEERAVKDGGSR
jgi:hypothetical protein